MSEHGDPSKIKIDNNIPVPKRTGNDKGITSTMRLLKKGESFLMPQGCSRQNVYISSHRVGIKVIARKTEEGIRIWRVG